MYDLKNMIKGIKNRYYGTSILGWCFILSLHLILCSCSSVQKRADASNQTVNETNNISTNPTLGRTSTIEKNIDKRPNPYLNAPNNLSTPLGTSVESLKARWIATTWDELPGWYQESLPQVWAALLMSCDQPSSWFANLCPLIKPLVIADEQEQRFFLMSHLQPYKILGQAGESGGLLTGYYEPVFSASRIKKPGFEVPIYMPTDEILSLKGNHSRWYSRQEIDKSEAVQKNLIGREIAWLADPVDLLILQIQGSGRINVLEPDGSKKWIKAVYAASNELPYQSVGRYLLDRGEITDASWSGIKAWINKNPLRVNELMWSNPRYVFFKEEPLKDPSLGPKGAQGIPLTAGRSVAVDPQNIPYGTPLWLFSDGPTLQLKRLVLAHDTGNAIVGPLRADYFVGTGTEAGEIAGRLKQNLNMWALLPR
jgi:membrane-bound lytic murein transglycosylase A